MKYIRTWIAATLCLLAFSAHRASAQIPVAYQRLFFSFFSDSENDRFVANGVQTNESSFISTVLINTGNVTRATHYDVAILKWADLASDLWTNLGGMEIVREVNLTNGAEGIYLRGLGRQTNISFMFTNEAGPTYLDDFTHQTLTQFPGLTNNFDPGLPLHRGSVKFLNSTNSPGITNNLRTEQMFFTSFNTRNLKFNYVGYGTIVPHPFKFRATPGGAILTTNVDTFRVHGVGDLLYARGSNVFHITTGLPLTNNTGPINGMFWTGEPVFAFVTNADGPITNTTVPAAPQ